MNWDPRILDWLTKNENWVNSQMSRGVQGLREIYGKALRELWVRNACSIVMGIALLMNCYSFTLKIEENGVGDSNKAALAFCSEEKASVVVSDWVPVWVGTVSDHRSLKADYLKAFIEEVSKKSGFEFQLVAQVAAKLDPELQVEWI